MPDKQSYVVVGPILPGLKQRSGILDPSESHGFKVLKKVRKAPVKKRRIAMKPFLRVGNEVECFKCQGWHRVISISTTRKGFHHYHLLCGHKLIDAWPGRPEKGVRQWLPHEEYDVVRDRGRKQPLASKKVRRLAHQRGRAAFLLQRRKEREEGVIRVANDAASPQPA